MTIEVIKGNPKESLIILILFVITIIIGILYSKYPYKIAEYYNNHPDLIKHRNLFALGTSDNNNINNIDAIAVIKGLLWDLQIKEIRFYAILGLLTTIFMIITIATIVLFNFIEL